MSTTPTRRYVVRGKSGVIAERIVMTTSRTAAIAHVASSLLSAEVATPDDIENLVSKGIRTERPGEAPAGDGAPDGGSEGG